MWLRLVANRLLPKRFGSQKFISDDHADEDQDGETDAEVGTLKQRPASRSLLFPVMSETITIDRLFTEEYRIFVSTWNVGGIPPPEDLNLEDWLDTGSKSYDIYILGFQEVVPLNAGNVLGSENPSICMKWNSLIRTALNRNDYSSNRASPQEQKSSSPGERQKVYPVNKEQQPFGSINYSMEKEFEGRSMRSKKGEFQCLMSKQMVGIMVTAWVRRRLRRLIRHPSVSCVGCGLMGCLGNKGSVSVRFLLNGTSFCFVCTHLASGEKEGDESHRNWGVSQIMSRTRFPAGPSMDLPRTILSHDRIIWLGDLNYRISLPDPETRSLVERHEWDTLHENDQLRVELCEGGVFEGWQEGNIGFAPTYKYSPDSDQYHGWRQQSAIGEKKRAPAWCDRILWYGKGIKQNRYERGESKLSDHRPVRATFTVITDIINSIKLMERCFSSERYENLDIDRLI
ncbi:type IV inositol polyphosphate 5-phosphatase 9-like [Nymphaea colorata]|nr:type IV inositol polyphosphate 5-phosphatase 9-like [Nymphaea colorata]